MTERQLCIDCLRPLATDVDEGVHNTRALCWRAWNGDVCCPQSPYAPPVREPTMNITDEEIEKLKNSQTMEEWDAICEEVQKVRGGDYPPDWWAKVKNSGIMDAATQRFGAGQLTVTKP